jgi:hypothetical protein
MLSASTISGASSSAAAAAVRAAAAEAMMASASAAAASSAASWEVVEGAGTPMVFQVVVDLGLGLRVSVVVPTRVEVG